MSAENEGKLGCGGLIILAIIAVVVLGALGGMGSDYDSWCPPDHPACVKEEGK